VDHDGDDATTPIDAFDEQFQRFVAVPAGPPPQVPPATDPDVEERWQWSDPEGPASTAGNV
jgi:hypothetical protein